MKFSIGGRGMYSYKPSFSHYDGYEIWEQKDLPGCESCGGRILPWELFSHIINPGHIGFDRAADLNIREACDDVFHKLIERWQGNG